MSFPESVLIIGEDPTAQAICQVLGLMGTECHKFATIPSNSEEKLNFIDILTYDNPRLVIAIAASPVQILTYVHQLRTNLEWAGKFITIVKNEKEKQELLNQSLFPENDEKFIYSNVPGHTAICEPHLISQLFENVMTMKGMYWNTWSNLVKSLPLSRDLQELEKLLSNNQLQEAQVTLNTLMARFNQVKWQEMIPHECKEQHRLLEKIQKTLTPKNPQEYYWITQSIKEIIKQTYLS